jgi:hypothetical protein
MKVLISNYFVVLWDGNNLMNHSLVFKLNEIIIKKGGICVSKDRH